MPELERFVDNKKKVIQIRKEVNRRYADDITLLSVSAGIQTRATSSKLTPITLPDFSFGKTRIDVLERVNLAAV